MESLPLLLSRVSMHNSDDGPARKKRRLWVDINTEEAMAIHSSRPSLPADVWAKALEFLPLHQLLPVSGLNRFFLREVSPLISGLHVHSPANLTGGAAVRRFGRVHRLEIPCWLSLARIDEQAPQRLIHFLQQFPNLSRVHLQSNQGFQNAGWIQLKKTKSLIAQVGQAYATGDLPQSLLIEGLLPTARRPLFCIMPCLCSLICESFPSIQVLEFNDDWCCVPTTLRLNMATTDRVPPVQFSAQYYNTSLIEKIQSFHYYSPDTDAQMMETDHDHNNNHAIQYSPSVAEYIDWLLQQGADPKQAIIRRIILGHADADIAAGAPRRPVTRSAWTKLQEWKVNVSEWEVRIVEDGPTATSDEVLLEAGNNRIDIVVEGEGMIG